MMARSVKKMGCIVLRKKEAGMCARRNVAASYSQSSGSYNVVTDNCQHASAQSLRRRGWLCDSVVESAVHRAITWSWLPGDFVTISSIKATLNEYIHTLHGQQNPTCSVLTGNVRRTDEALHPSSHFRGAGTVLRAVHRPLATMRGGAAVASAHAGFRLGQKKVGTFSLPSVWGPSMPGFLHHFLGFSSVQLGPWGLLL